MQLIIHTMQTFISTFHPYYATFFSIFHCQVLHNVDKKLQNKWIIVHFLQNFHWTTWSRGIQVLPLQGSCNSFVFWRQLAWGNYSTITSSISSIHKINFFWKNNYILDLWGEGRTFNHCITFFSLERNCARKILNALITVRVEQLKVWIVFLLTRSCNCIELGAAFNIWVLFTNCYNLLLRWTIHKMELESFWQILM
jgi:hypothetical protein